jgi:hypothetical protein
MDRSILLFLIGLIFGGGIGFTLAAGNAITFDHHEHDHSTKHAEHSAHQMVSMSADGDFPTVDLEITPDPVSGWNLSVSTENFHFAPENAGGSNNIGEGHAHIYVNGTKVSRLYGRWMHLSELPAGKVDVKVSLNANDHSPLAVDGELVEKTISISNSVSN